MDMIYCHGLPGSPTELQPLAPAARLNGVTSLDRLAWPSASYAEGVLAAFDAIDTPAPVDVAGFSLGAMAALHIAAHRPTRVRELILISPAAPLELGDFLPAMAGRPVFDAARRGEFALRLLSAAQGALASLAPRFMLNTMFASSTAAEQRLLQGRDFRAMVIGGLRDCLGPRQRAYRAELAAYVQPWAHILDLVSCPSEIWQGDEDAWTPPIMAEALQARLGPQASLRMLKGLGHYTTLKTVLAENA